MVMLALILLTLASAVDGFIVAPTQVNTLTVLNVKKDDNDYLSSFFTGGIFDGKEYEEEAIKIASKIKSSSVLGWKTTGNNRLKRGKTRPRHRAFGGQDEKPIQLKPAYDESSQYCPEKWLTQEDMNNYLRCTEGPASDTVFVALARGAKYAERDDCEKRIQEWYSTKSFDKQAFLKSVKQGRQELITGWVLYLLISGSAAAGIIFPNNPLNKQLEAFIDFVRGTST